MNMIVTLHKYYSEPKIILQISLKLFNYSICRLMDIYCKTKMPVNIDQTEELIMFWV